MDPPMECDIRYDAGSCFDEFGSLDRYHNLCGPGQGDAVGPPDAVTSNLCGMVVGTLDLNLLYGKVCKERGRSPS